ncbi:MAG: hypothetical protein LBR23_05435, partial [Spirochaetaceae bacterium]|jgi:hypothetical protein|nr:hypothetical protein [Spirochaetaceae bacterium]
VRRALKALGKRPSASDGARNRMGFVFMGLLPRAFATRILGMSMNAMFGPFKSPAGEQGKFERPATDAVR